MRNLQWNWSEASRLNPVATDMDDNTVFDFTINTDSNNQWTSVSLVVKGVAIHTQPLNEFTSGADFIQNFYTE